MIFALSRPGAYRVSVRYLTLLFSGIVLTYGFVHVVPTTHAQGFVNFRNQGVDLEWREWPIFIQNSTVGAGTIPNMTAQLVLVQDGSLVCLSPSTPFAGMDGIAAAYVQSVDVLVPGNTGTPVTLKVQVYNGETFESSTWRGESKQFEITPTLSPNRPAILNTVEPFTVSMVPEPTFLSILLVGAIFIAWRKGK